MASKNKEFTSLMKVLSHFCKQHCYKKHNAVNKIISRHSLTTCQHLRTTRN